MTNKSTQKLLSELIDLNKRTSELRREIDKRERQSTLKQLKKYIGNCYRETSYGKGTYCYILYINEDCQLIGTILHKYSNETFNLDFNDTIHTDNNNTYKHLKKISKEKWDGLIKGLKPEINKGLN